MIACLPLLLGAAPAGPVLGAIHLQLYYKTTGTLSADVAPPVKLSFWNTSAGEGERLDIPQLLYGGEPLPAQAVARIAHSFGTRAFWSLYSADRGLQALTVRAGASSMMRDRHEPRGVPAGSR